MPLSEMGTPTISSWNDVPVVLIAGLVRRFSGCSRRQAHVHHTLSSDQRPMIPVLLVAELARDLKEVRH